MKILANRLFFILIALLITFSCAQAQENTKVMAKVDPPEIMVGDHIRLFLEVQNISKEDRVIWGVLPDTFNHLEILERGNIDTTRQGDVTIYKQRLIITGFDSGLFRIPAVAFTIVPLGGGAPYVLKTDSFDVLVQTVAVDTTQPFKGIKGIRFVKTSWRDYIWYITGGLIALPLIIFAAIYWRRKKDKPVPAAPVITETLPERTLRQLDELNTRNLWQQGKVKEYYSLLTEILRTYIEERFSTPAMEITTDELLFKAKVHREMQPHVDYLAGILPLADLAKFAKALPTEQEHIAAMENAKKFIVNSTPNILDNTP